MDHPFLVGTGPAALMAARVLLGRGLKPWLFERRPAPGWKLLVAGSSGLNVSHGGPEEELATHYTKRSAEMAACLRQFGRTDWLQTLAELGEETYLGTSRRYFIRNEKASLLLSRWVEELEAGGAKFFYGEELTDFTSLPQGVRVRFSSGREEMAPALLLALGGGSWEVSPPHWPALLSGKGLCLEELRPANAGFSLDAPADFFSRAEGRPVKGLTLHTTRGSKTGECMITRYGLEGTPVYSVGVEGLAHVDLKPDLTVEKLAARLASVKPGRRLAAAKLSPGAILLFECFAPANAHEDSRSLAHALKRLPLPLLAPRPLSESISSAGGLSWDELSPELEIKKAPGVFAAGEMVDWDAPTGGFLLQGAVSMGAVAAMTIAKRRSLH